MARKRLQRRNLNAFLVGSRKRVHLGGGARVIPPSADQERIFLLENTIQQRTCFEKMIPFRLLSCLKGLGHAILGNFSTDQMVIELTKIWK